VGELAGESITEDAILAAAFGDTQEAAV
jgi:hypothetical protein